MARALRGRERAARALAPLLRARRQRRQDRELHLEDVGRGARLLSDRPASRIGDLQLRSSAPSPTSPELFLHVFA
eukprot:6062817-Pleurochrysis_carterae.AAC.1